MDNLPLVTIAIPTYNRVDLLRRCVKSVLNQNYKNIEVCISDNASTDRTYEFIEELKGDIRIKSYRSPVNQGMVANWDKCLSMSNGEYFLMMSDDDAFLEENAVTKFVEAYRANNSKDIGFIFSNICIESSDGKLTDVESQFSAMDFEFNDLIYQFYEGNVPIYPCATMFRRSDILSKGGYGVFGAKLGVDACMWISMLLKYSKARYIPNQLTLYRNHQSLTTSPVKIWKNDYTIIKNLILKEDYGYLKSIIKKSIKTIEKSEKKLAISYISRNLKYNKNYKFKEILFDIFDNKGDLFSIVNISYMLRIVLKKFN